MNAAYVHEAAVYVNLTDRCPSACVFCPKIKKNRRFGAWDLTLAREPSAGEAASAASALLVDRPGAEIVFCGYGETTLRLGAALDCARLLRRRFPGSRLRLNTIGLGSAAAGRDIVPELALFFDAVSVSLNAPDSESWRRLVHPAPRYAFFGFAEVCRFITRCVEAGLDTTATAPLVPGVDAAAVERLARALGAKFRARPAL